MASTTAQISLNAVSTGSGATVDFAAAKRNVTVVLSSTGQIDSGFVHIEASQDNSVWVVLATLDPGRKSGDPRVYHNTVGAFRYWRARIDSVFAVAGGGRVTATFMEAD